MLLEHWELGSDIPGAEIPEEPSNWRLQIGSPCPKTSQDWAAHWKYSTPNNFTRVPEVLNKNDFKKLKVEIQR